MRLRIVFFMLFCVISLTPFAFSFQDEPPLPSEFMDYAGTLGGLWALVIVVSETVDRFTKLDGKAALIQSWVVGIVLAIAAAYFNVGMFAEEGLLPFYYEGAIVGFIMALVANGTFKVNVAKAVLEKIKVRPKDKE